ncbi:MAG: hypothetical protein M3680_21495 [Myxococcota bacterium]|nr:hypothetical protein [Myxococcota bacterium]
MAELADEPLAEQRTRKAGGLGALAKKRWRGWLRAIHRDVGYLAVGFTVIYALSGIAMNHVDDWNYNYNASERSLSITPVPDEASDAEAAQLVATAAGLGTPTEVFRAGDEVRLSYANGTKVTAIGADVTVQTVKSRFFFRAATWLHAAKGKTGWKYIADAYAILLLYLAFSGLLMIKGKLGFKWRGLSLVAAGFAVPVTYLLITGGPEAQVTEPTTVTQTTTTTTPPPPATAPPAGDGIKLLPPSDDE